MTVAMSAAPGPATSGRCATRRPAESGAAPNAVAASLAHDGRRPQAQHLGRGQGARRAIGALVEMVGVGEKQDEPGLRACRGQVSVEQRLEVAHRRRQPGRLLDLERELTGGGSVGPGGYGQDGRRVRELGRDRLGGRGLVEAGGQRGAHVSRVRMPTGQMAGDGQGSQDGRQVADRVAPALIGLVGGDDDVGKAPAGRAVGDGDQGGARARVAGREERRVRGPSAALVGDADHEAASLGSERRFECLDGLDARRQAGSHERFLQDERTGHRTVLAGATADDTDRRPGAGGLAQPAGQHRGRRRGLRQPAQEPFGERGLGGHHVGHHERWAVTLRRRR